MAVNADKLPPRYRDPVRIGHGGMGEILRARDETLDREVAVKLLAERFARDEDVRGRFTREALAAARLSGEPGVVTIFDVGEWAGRPYIVMEYLPGGSLEDVVTQEGAQDPGRALDWIEQAGRALDAAHRQGIVHRDVKPANLLLDRHGHVNVADFGIATATGQDTTTRPGTILGTAGYLAPEQALGKRATPASDRYALGVVAFELLSGSRPYAADSATAEASAHVNAPVPAISARRPDLPPELDAVFRTALAKDPDERFASCAELGAALRDALDREAGPTRVLAPPPPPLARPRPAAPPRRPTPVLPLVLTGIVLLAGAGAVTAAVLTGGEETSEEPRVTTVVRTEQGTTEVVTTTAPPPEEEPPPPTTAAEEEPSGAELNDRGFALMQQGDYESALPLLEEAVAKLEGSGELAEAYAAYNLAVTRLELGRCEGVPELLDRSQQVQGERREIAEARARYEEECG